MTTVAARRRRTAERNRIERERAVAEEMASRPGVIRCAEMAIELRRKPHARKDEKSQIEVLHGREAISDRQLSAARKLREDWHLSGLDPWATAPDGVSGSGHGKTPGCGPRYAEYMAAARALGALSNVVAAVVFYDFSPSRWATERGMRSTDGIGVLRMGLDVLCEHYWLQSRR